MSFERIAIAGAGAWGSALANTIARAGRRVTLVARSPASAEAIARTRESPRLAGFKLEAAITVVAANAADLAAQDALLLAVPSQHLRQAARALAPALATGVPVVACAKGIERETHKFMTEVIAECAPRAEPAILSGPGFAEELARGLPAATTLAAQDEARAAALAQALGSATFRPYHSTDVRGVEIGGAAKNVLAIAAGIVAGRGLGASAAAALVTRGFAELFRFGRALGARPETLTGLSGLGDLILTCSNAQSRNFSLGIRLGRGQTPAQASAAGALAEGAFTAAALIALADEASVEMPIARAVAAILEGSSSVDEAIESLLTRPFKAEG
jgi:glycerol-3-phosphate dehydrogenase (NAD(P)+)